MTVMVEEEWEMKFLVFVFNSTLAYTCQSVIRWEHKIARHISWWRDEKKPLNIFFFVLEDLKNLNPFSRLPRGSVRPLVEKAFREMQRLPLVRLFGDYGYMWFVLVWGKVSYHAWALKRDMVSVKQGPKKISSGLSGFGAETFPYMSCLRRRQTKPSDQMEANMSIAVHSVQSPHSMWSFSLGSTRASDVPQHSTG